MEQALPKATPRPIRISIPARVEFEGERFTISEFTSNVSEGGVFLLTEHMVPPGTRGRLTFRISQWDPPFTVEAEVVRVVAPERDDQELQPGLGIRFIQLEEPDRRRIERLIEGVCSGSVIETIRRSILEVGRTLETELRHRPTDQKLMLAIGATGKEIEALIRDGQPAVMQRLLDNPRLQVGHVRRIVADPRMPVRVLLDVQRQQRWFRDDEIRTSFCRHPGAPFENVRTVLPTLSVAGLRQIVGGGTVAKRVRDLAREIVRRKGGQL